MQTHVSASFPFHHQCRYLPDVFIFVTLGTADNVLGGAPMSPVRGAADVAKNFGRALSVNVDVNDSSGSDWDCESTNAEHGEVLVRCW